MIAPAPALWRRALAELLGTGVLVAIVVGSGIAAQRLSPGDTGIELLENSLATALGLGVLILVLQPVSGAHFNPVVTLVDAVRGSHRRASEVAAYLLAQFAGAIGGALLADAMFGAPVALSQSQRADPGRVLGEVVATALLVLVVFGLAAAGRDALAAPAVGAYIGAAYWFTSSTSFANPAVTVGRVFSDTFAGIAPASVPWFVAAQLVGGALGAALTVAILPRKAPA